MELMHPIRINTPQIVHESIDGEVIIIDFECGYYYSLRYVAAQIWNMIDSGVPVPYILDTLKQRFVGEPEVIVQTTCQFLDLLQKSQLIVEADIPTPQLSAAAEVALSASDTGVMQPFVAPTIQQYTDMQDLLLLDPIHDVDAAGWPHVKADATSA